MPKAHRDDDDVVVLLYTFAGATAAALIFCSSRTPTTDPSAITDDNETQFRPYQCISHCIGAARDTQINIAATETYRNTSKMDKKK